MKRTNETPIDIDAEDVNELGVGVSSTPVDEVAASQVLSSIGGKGEKGKKRLRRSKCWSQFTELPVGPDGIEYCKCNFCFLTLTCTSKFGTGHLLCHMEKCKKKDTREIGQLLLSSGNTSGSIALSDGSINIEKFRELLAGAITMHNLPFQFAEYQGIRACFEYLRPSMHHVSRNTAKADILKLYVQEKMKIKKMFETSASRVSLTSDLWTAINSDGYLVVTAHFIDKDWFLRKYILCLSYMKSPHTGVALADKLYDVLKDWGLIEKLSTLTLDNAFSNDLCVSYLKSKLISRKSLVLNGDLFHVRCCAHILNLIVQEGLKEDNIVIDKVRESVKYVRGSQGRKQKFLECVKSLCLDGKQGLRQDVPTRWNSTYLMLKSSLYYKNAFEHLKLSDSNYNSCPSTEEWEKADVLCSFLAMYYNLTCLFSGTKYPTANLFFPAIHKVYHKLKNECGNPDDNMKNMAVRMLKKFEKYWANFNETLAIAIILDPRYKMKFVEWAYRKVYDGEAETHALNVRKRLFNLFDEYVQHYTSTFGSSSSMVRKSGIVEHEAREVTMQTDDADFYDDFDSDHEGAAGEKKTELDMYLAEPRMNRMEELDILNYWGKHHPRFPLVAAMARDFLCIPITTVASESAFSCSGRIIDRFRSSIKNENVEALLCLRDWIYGEQDLAEAIEEFNKFTEDVLQPDNVHAISDVCSNMTS